MQSIFIREPYQIRWYDAYILAIVDDKNSITLTFHELAKAIDTGAIYLKKKLNLSNLFKTSVKAKKIAAKVFSEYFNK